MGKQAKKTLLISIPMATWKAIKRQSKENNRSVRAEISEILENSQLPIAVTSGDNTTSVTFKNVEI